LEGKEKIVDRLVALWKKNAGSSSFDVANKFAGSIQEIDLAVGNILDDQDAFEIVVAVKEAADWNAFEAKSLTKSKFSDAPKLVDAAKKYMADQEATAESFVISKAVADSLADFVAAVFDD